MSTTTTKSKPKTRTAGTKPAARAKATPSTRKTTKPATKAAKRGRRSFPRHFTANLAGADVFTTAEWELRVAEVGDKFRQEGVEFPASWSQRATNIVAEKYFRGQVDSPSREYSVRQMIGRVAGTIADWGVKQGYFAGKAARDAFYDEFAYILLHQMAAQNSPVWFNVGFEEEPQCSACFLLSVEDTFDPDNPDNIQAWNDKEGKVFRGGSGAGINVSNIRGSKERMSKGGFASGPLSFMEGTDAWAGVIKSGGKTRRAAKMVVMDIDHPDVIEFIKAKAEQEGVADDLRALGYPMDLDSDYLRRNVTFQNANNSVRLSDEFMRAVERGDTWNLIARSEVDPATGEKKVMETVDARWLMKLIAECAHRCGDPGVHFDTTQNRWHTNPNTGPITTSNPCSEYLSIDNSACNLASLNFMTFFEGGNGDLNLDDYAHTIDVVLLAQEIVVSASSYPTEQITKNAEAFRQLGMGGVNLGALIMAMGLPYDSAEGRALASALTSYMSARAWRQSALMAKEMGAYEGFALNRDAHLKVISMHLDEHRRHTLDGTFGQVPRQASDLVAAAEALWLEALELGEKYGYRNAQVTLYAPTGTISFLMDCDTTGMEPDYSLVKEKKMVGGGIMTMVNQSVNLALRKLGYDEQAAKEIEEYIVENGDVVDCPLINLTDVPVFDVAVGRRSISPMGHVKMMASLQPFISGAISKTVNMPQETTVEDIETTYVQSWRMGIKALAIYRAGSKATSVFSHGEEVAPEDMTPSSKSAFRPDEVEAMIGRAVRDAEARPKRTRMPKTRLSVTHKVNLGGGQTECYMTAGYREDGTLGEMFITGLDNEGSDARGLGNAFATAFSMALQYGCPLYDFLQKFTQDRFGDGAGVTGNPEIPMSSSLIDYMARVLALEFLPADEWESFALRPSDRTRELRAKYPRLPISAAALVDEHSTGVPAPAPVEATLVEFDDVVEAITEAALDAPAESLAEKADRVRAEAQAKRERGEVVKWESGRCSSCGSSHLLRSGSCLVCDECGSTTGCG